MSLLKLKDHWLLGALLLSENLQLLSTCQVSGITGITLDSTQQPCKSDFFFFLQLGKSVQSGYTDESGFENR